MPHQRTIFDRLAASFEVEWYELLLERDPGHLDALDALAMAYTANGDYERGLAIDRRLAAARPADPTVRYNLACSLSLTGDYEGAAQSLVDAIALGYRDFGHLMEDDDLAALRASTAFAQVTQALTHIVKETYGKPRKGLSAAADPGSPSLGPDAAGHEAADGPTSSDDTGETF